MGNRVVPLRARGGEETEKEFKRSWINTDFIPTLGSPSEDVIWEQSITPVLAVLVQCQTCLATGFYFQESPLASFTILGTLVSLITVFRSNQAYQRYWEARSTLGMLMAGLVDAAGSTGALLNSGACKDDEWRTECKTELARLLRLYVKETVMFLRKSSIEIKKRTMYWIDSEEVQKSAVFDLGKGGKDLSEG